MYIYRVREDKLADEDGETRTVFGIEVIDGAPNNTHTVRSVKDVFFDREKAEQLVGLCNTLGLSLVHLDDVIEDAMG